VSSIIAIISSILVTLFFIQSRFTPDEETVTHFTISDSIRIDVKEYGDDQGLIETYGAHIVSPVCGEGKCYTVEIELFWDLIGRFHHYDTIPGKGLTKLDHIPFTSSDYTKLSGILATPHSLLASYSKEELVKNTQSPAIDGVTGATINEIQENVIGGAAFSCHTLWHIAYGPVVDSLRKVTTLLLSKDLVVKLVNQQDQEINYFLINNIPEADFGIYLPEVFQAIENGEGYFAKNAIEKIPNEFICDTLGQEFFASHFSQLDYFAQVALLEKLNVLSLSKAMILALKENTDDRNSYKNHLIEALLAE
jgi:hypothetical protein